MMKEKENDGFSVIWSFLTGAKRFFAAGMIFACLSTIAEMIRPKIIQYTIDGILGDDVSQIPAYLQSMLAKYGSTELLKRYLWIPALAVVICSLIAVLLKYWYQVSNVKGSETFVKTMRDRLFEHIEHVSIQWHTEHQTGDIIQRCTEDIEEVKVFLSEHLINLISMVITILLALWFMFRIDIYMALIALTGIPILVISSYLFHQKITESFRACDENEGVLSGIAQENFTGVRVVRAFGREASEQQKFAVQNRKVTTQWIKLGVHMCIYFSLTDFLTGLLVAGILILGTVRCVGGHCTVGALLAMLSYMAMLIRPVRSMGRILSEMSKTTVSVRRLNEIMQAKTEEKILPVEEADTAEKKSDVTDVTGTPMMPPLTGEIRFEHVNFGYPGSPEILHDLDFVIPGGSTLGILGNTGSGKSTIAQLLCRLYPLESGQGRITIDGVDIRRIDLQYLRTHVGYVLQEPFLFSRSLAENIAITMENPPEELIRESARAACMESVIDDFPKGFDTFVGERGVTLSGGQKQRTAIARTLTLQAPILIFDDSLSAVDMETDAKIRENLKTYMKDTTVILISHRISTLMDADQILVLQDGHITASGTHEELIQQEGLYRMICNIQQMTTEDKENPSPAQPEHSEEGGEQHE